MRKSSIAGVTLTCGVIIGMGWHMGAGGAVDTPQAISNSLSAAQPSASTVPTVSPSATPITPSASPSPSRSATPTPAASSQTINGDVESTRYGDVQVSVTFSGSTITDVKALKLTNEDSRSVSISNRAAPLLRQEVLNSQSAKVHTISGATYTSSGYLASLQSALDKHGA